MRSDISCFHGCTFVSLKNVRRYEEKGKSAPQPTGMSLYFLHGNVKIPECPTYSFYVVLLVVVSINAQRSGQISDIDIRWK